MKAISLAMTALAGLSASAASAQDFGSIVGAVRDAVEEGGEAASGEAHAGLHGVPDGAYENEWRSSTRSRFHHVLEGPPGRTRLTIHAVTDSPGGETVAVYPQTAGGERGSARIGFVIATTAGNSRELFVTIPQPGTGQETGRLPIIVDVENASGNEYSGRYSITLEPA